MADEQNSIKQKVERTNKHSAFTFFVFLAISTAAWFLVKLSEDYTTQTSFGLQLTEAPADQWVSSDEQSVKMSFNVDGFHVLRYKMIREPKRYVTIDLNEVSYRQESGDTYSFSSQYVAEKIADRLGINASDITMNDSKIYFSMSPLKSKVVPIVLRSDIKMQRQFGLYGIPTLEPASVTIYGPDEVIDTVRSVRTEVLAKTNVSEGFSESVALDLLGGKLHSNTTEVKATFEVDKFTEMDLEVPIGVADNLKVRFFPETMSVKCLVAMRDYASITTESFTATVDRDQLEAMQPLLDLRLVTWPPTVQILATRPDKVEYLIVQ
jgi:hypothetical protein